MASGNTTGQCFNFIGVIATLSNGTIDGTAITQVAGSGDTNECDPIISRNGAAVTIKNLKVTIDSITGCCAYAFKDSTITIQSGTYKNKTTVQYQYNPSLTALTLNQYNYSTQSVFVRGGTFYGNNPANGDESGMVTSFLASGYKSVETASGSNIWKVSK